MNKSKLLKKSLAMLLAVMMVVAMIPLGASAAAPKLDWLNVNGKAIAVDANSTVEATISASAINVVVFSNEQGTSTLTARHSDGVYGTTISDDATTAATTPLVLSNFNEVGGVVSIPVEYTNTSGETSNYTLKLTRSTSGSTANLASVTHGTSDGIVDAEYNNTTKIITVTTTYAFSSGVINVVTADDATVAGSSTAAITVIPAGASFTVTSGEGINYTWTVVVKTVAPLTSFSINGKAGKITDADSDGVNDTITVTLTEDDVKDTYGDVVTSPSLPVTFTTLANTTVAGAAISGGNDMTNGGKYTFTNLGTDTFADDTITVTCNNVGATYTLKVSLTPSDAKDITYAKINTTIATISGNQITAVLPKGEALASCSVTFRIPTGATAAADFAITQTPSTIGYEEYTGTADLTKEKGIRVTAADGTTKAYYISATTGTVSSVASITAFSVKNGDTEYKATINENLHKITVTVPFMTKTMQSWVVYATPDSNAKAYLTDGTTGIVNGETTVAAISTSLDAMTDGTTKIIADAVISKNLADPKNVTKYSLEVKFEAAKNGKTLTSTTVVAMDSGKTDKEVYRGTTTANTYKMAVDNSAKKVSVEVAFSHAASTLYVTDFAAALGGVVFKADGTQMTAIVPTVSTPAPATSIIADGDTIYVFPELVAKTISSGGDITTNLSYGTPYTVSVTSKAASKSGLLSSLTVGDTTLTVSGKVIKGTIPYSATAGAADGTNGQFVGFKASDFATVGTSTVKLLPSDNGTTASPTDGQLLFVRGANNTVTVYIWNGTAATELDGTSTKTLDVFSEYDEANNLGATNSYSFDVKYSDPHTDAAITSFSLNGRAGSISGQTITVALSTDVDKNGLIPTFTTSVGASVADEYGVEVKSGVTPLNFTKDVKLLVTAEDKSKTVTYTVKIVKGERFSDVAVGTWYYDYVNAAADAGIIVGFGDGTLRPNTPVTRGQFAKMIANTLGYNEDLYKGVSRFPDVPVTEDNSNSYTAINYCYDQGIIGGYSDGEFKPGNPITRAEMAKMVALAMKYEDAETSTTCKESFSDDDAFGWARSYIYCCVNHDLLNGMGDGTYAPRGQFTRAQAAKVVVEMKNK